MLVSSKRDITSMRKNTKIPALEISTKWSKMIGKLSVRRKRKNIKMSSRKKRTISKLISITQTKLMSMRTNFKDIMSN